MESISATYSEFTTNTRFENLKPEVVSQTKKLILDLIGVSLAGYKLMEFPRMMVDYVTSLGGNPEATIIQTKKKFPAVNAALANAACAHGIDMDDGHRFGALHPGTVIIPAALAATELSKASTKELIAGIVVGYEVMIRIGMAIVPSSLNRGFHITGITGPFGAAAAAANILALSREETVGALGMAGLQSSGLIQVNHEVEGAKVKPLNPARAAMSGLFSCILAKRGFQGPCSIFEGEDGFLKAVTDEVKHELLTQNLGEEFEIQNVYLKLYAACRHAHAPIDAALLASANSQMDVSAIEKIVVETYPAAVRLAGITHATSPSAGRFSIPFSVALALIRGDAEADKYSEQNIGDETIQRLAAKVQLAVGPKWERLYPLKRGATVTIIAQNRVSWSSEVDLAKGEPENPASWKEIYKKFFNNATLLLSEPQTEKLRQTIIDLENASIYDLIMHL
ncbi:MAG: MmgE/PrpD family protein [Deltaproteobacteria bacterium]|jgi:2-methylcitrate dehydratase PrpD|nr:MmgE/PrpD family protein [Deltaproteobacteria bacterium]